MANMIFCEMAPSKYLIEHSLLVCKKMLYLKIDKEYASERVPGCGEIKRQETSSQRDNGATRSTLCKKSCTIPGRLDRFYKDLYSRSPQALHTVHHLTRGRDTHEVKRKN